MLRFIDTFAGVGGFRLAAERAASDEGEPAECVMSVEIDSEARKTYESNHGDLPSEDMTKIDPGDFPDHDLLLGGFPCQTFSRNGKFYNHNDRRLGDDDRKNLVFTLMEVLRSKQPKYFVFENVKEIRTILNADGSSFYDTLMDNLADCGYDVVCEVLDTARFGLPQQRKRAYFVGARKDLGLRYVHPDGSDLGKCVGDILDKDVAPKYLLENLWRNRRYGAQPGRSVRWIVDAMRKRKMKALFVDLLEQRYADATEPPLRLDILKMAVECGEWAPPPGRVSKIWPLGILYGDTPSLLPRQTDKLYSRLGIAPTIATFSTPAFDAPEGWRILTPRECFRLQGFPETMRIPANDSVAYKQAGNAVTVDVATAVIKRLLQIAAGSQPVLDMPAIPFKESRHEPR